MLGDLFARVVRVAAAFAGDQDVEVADGFASAAQRAGGRDLFDSGRRQQMRNQLLGQLLGRVEQKPSADAAIVFDRLQQLLFMLFAHARQFANLSFARQLFDAIEIADLVGAPDQGDRLRAEALNLEQFEHRRAILFQQLGVDFDACRL